MFQIGDYVFQKGLPFGAAGRVIQSGPSRVRVYWPDSQETRQHTPETLRITQLASEHSGKRAAKGREA